MQWHSLCDVLDAPALKEDPRFSDGKRRREHRERLRGELEARLRSRTAAEWLNLMRRASVPAGPVHDMAGVFDDPQVKALNVLQRVEHPDLGSVDVMRGPLHMAGRPTPVSRPAPLLGQHTIEVLEEFGLDDCQLAELVGAGVITGAAAPTAVV